MSKKKFSKLTQDMYDGQKLWIDKNWTLTLNTNHSKIEKFNKKIGVINIWSDALHDNDIARKFMPEIFTDSYMSIHFACMGLYKYAYMCLRSQEEAVLRLIYFVDHPVEFNWWLEGNDYYRKGFNAKFVWGDDYKYFNNLEIIKSFEDQCEKNKKIFSGGGVIEKTYDVLSKYVHSNALFFQTGNGNFMPKFDKDKFEKWAETFVLIQITTNVLFTLIFSEIFIKRSKTDRSTILDIGVEDSTYKKIIKSTLSI